MLALRQATRRLTQVYDHFLAPSGVRGTQFSILARLRRSGAVTISEMAEAMVMDRTTLARNLKPLQRSRLVVVSPGADRRQREIRLTDKGLATIDQALPLWRRAQHHFETRYGRGEAERLREMLRDVSMTDVVGSE
ncbi:MAG TPA: MarR family transcriptional regulator [Stellaceae bacterium]|nr:MarR family transcriptional regulator [Stellaceae bacterium]